VLRQDSGARMPIPFFADVGCGPADFRVILSFVIPDLDFDLEYLVNDCLGCTDPSLNTASCQGRMEVWSGLFSVCIYFLVFQLTPWHAQHGVKTPLVRKTKTA